MAGRDYVICVDPGFFSLNGEMTHKGGKSTRKLKQHSNQVNGTLFQKWEIETGKTYAHTKTRNQLEPPGTSWKDLERNGTSNKLT